MARRGFFSRLISEIRELAGLPAVSRRREQQRRAFGRGKRTRARAAEDYAQRARDQRATRNAQAQRRREEQRDPLERIWREEQPGKRIRKSKYEGHRELFESMPGMEFESQEDKEDLWRSYVENMVYGRHGYRFNDPRNPFWNDMGIDPRDFDWSEWRKWIDTP